MITLITMVITMNDYDVKTCMTSKQEAKTTGETETFCFLFYKSQNDCQHAIITNIFIDLKIIDNMQY